MDRASELSIRIKQREMERKEQERMAKIKTNCKLEWKQNRWQGYTKSGKFVIFEGIKFGLTMQGLYGAGTLSVKDNDTWITVFTKGYPSKALEWMENN